MAQPSCPLVSFQSAYSTSLLPGPSSHINLLRQDDGSYTAYEIANSSPYPILRTTSNFQKHLIACPPGLPAKGIPPQDAPQQAFAHTSSGGYLFVQRTDAYSTPGNYYAIDVAEFDANLNLVSETVYPVLIAEAIAIADVNGDGILDIIVGAAHPHSVTLEILLGNGGSSFQPPVDYPIAVSLNIQSLAIGDLNEDHKPDVVVASGFIGGKISIFLGNGDGTFQKEIVPFSLPANPHAVAIGDLNRDGKADLAFTIQEVGQNELSVSLGMGNGAFAPLATYAVGGSDSFAIGDMNGDGIPDIVTSGISILYGDGTGSFPQRRDYLQETDGSIILTDFDGDGKMDVVIGTGSPMLLAGTSLAVLFGRANQTFFGPPVSLVPGLPAPDNEIIALAAADFNHDGRPDLVSSDIQRHINVLQGANDGSFQPVFQFDFPAGSEIPYAIAVKDFNQDGKLDFAVVQGGSVEVFLGKGDGTFQSPLEAPAPVGAFSLAAGDFNGDGRPDLAVLVTQEASGTSDTVLILLGNGDGTFTSHGSYPVGPFAHGIAAGDLNGDGKPDLVITDAGTSANQNQDGNLALLFGKGDGTFTPAPEIPLTAGIGRGPYGLAIADFNGDGKLDLAVALSDYSNYRGGLVILLGHGDGTFQPPASYFFTAVDVLTGDINGDGIPDLIVNGTGYLLGRGDGTFQVEVPFFSTLEAPLNPAVLSDFNGDGKLDVAEVALAGGIATFLNISQPPPSLAVVSAASFVPGPLAPDSLATVFGKNLATPSGTVITIQDSTGATRTAPVLYVSPEQINFLVPAGTSPGLATVTITPNGAAAQRLPAEIAQVAPALFSVNANGLAAAYAVLVTSQGIQTTEPVYTITNGTAVPAPVSWGSSTDQAYLILYGTGIRGAQGNVSASIHGVNAMVNATIAYAGAQPQFPGLDRVDILIPASLAGSGIVRVILTVDGITANTVYVSVQ